MNGFESALFLSQDVFQFAKTSTGSGIAAWILTIVFAWSGIAKLRQPTLAAIAMVDFGVVRRVRSHLGAALGAAELSLALILVMGVLPTVFLPLTAVLLWFFVLLIARSLRSGKRFACFCFGQADSELSRLTLIRTGSLALIASVLAIPLPTGTYAEFSSIYALQAVSAMAIVGTIVLGSKVSSLVRWNRDPYVVRKTEVS